MRKSLICLRDLGPSYAPDRNHVCQPFGWPLPNHRLTANQNMKTIMDLLISLHRFEHSVLVASRGRQLTRLEEKAARRHVDLVREVIPKEALRHYEQMKQTNADLLASPEVFAMAVVVATYRSLSPAQRREFVARYGIVSSPHSPRPEPPAPHRNTRQQSSAARCARAVLG